MPAIVRKTMGKNLSGDLLTDILNSSNEYYIGIGKCDTYNDADTVVTPIDSPREEREFRNNLQSIKKVEGVRLRLRKRGLRGVSPSGPPRVYRSWLLEHRRRPHGSC